MKRLLAFLAVYSSLAVAAQDSSCTVLGIQDLTQLVLSLQAELDSIQSQIDGQPQAMTRDSVIGIAIHKELQLDEITRGDLSTLSFPGADLAGASLYGADLQSVNLSFADLSFSDLSYSNLSNALLPASNLQGANLDSTNMTQAYLVDANLLGASLNGANLSGANLAGADMSGSSLYSAVLTDTYMGCLRSCPEALPAGYICQQDFNCMEPNRYRIVPE